MSYLNQVENQELIKELVRRTNKGELELSLISCCQLSQYFNFVLQQVKEINQKVPDYQECCLSAMKVFTAFVLIMLKKEKKICANCSTQLSEIKKKVGLEKSND